MPFLRGRHFCFVIICTFTLPYQLCHLTMHTLTGLLNDLALLFAGLCNYLYIWGMNRLYKGITAVAIVIALIFGFKACSYAKKLDNEIAENIKLKTANQSYTVRIRKDSTTIYTQKILQANQQAANAHSGERKTQTSVKAKIGVKIEGVIAEYTKLDTIIKYVGANCDSLLDAQAANTIPIGSKFSKVDKWYSLSGTLDTNSVKDISFEIPPGNISVVITGREGKEKATLTIQNPYIDLSNISSVTVKQKRPLLLSRTACIIYGAILGTATYIAVK